MMPLTGSREISTKPVTTVPTMAPAVPIAESLPTTVPVSLRLVSRSLVTIGVTAARNVPGTMIANGDQHQQRAAIERARRAYGERSCSHRHPGHRQQRTQRPARRHHIGYSASSPGAQGNGSQRHADDQGARLQGETEVGPATAARPPRRQAHWPMRRRPTPPRRTGPAQATQDVRRRSRPIRCSPLDHATGRVTRAERAEDVDLRSQSQRAVNCLTAILPMEHTGLMATSLFEVVVEPNRRRILDLLRDGDRSVNDLVDVLDIAQPTVSKHLKALREAGLVVVRPVAQSGGTSSDRNPCANSMRGSSRTEQRGRLASTR